MDKGYKFTKENGIFYTDKKLAMKMVGLLNIDYTANFTLIEPAVGEGHILSLIVNRYFTGNKTKTDKEKIEFLENNIAGFNIRDIVNRHNTFREIQRDLGKDYDVILKETHIHIEYDPK